MPELPEVEAARRAIQEHCIGKKIKSSIIANDSKVIDGVSPSDFEASLVGKTIVGAHRKGKNMWLQLDSPPFPSFQFGMAGAIYIKGVAVTKYKRSAVNDTDEWPSKYSKFFIELDDGLELSFTDKRRFAKVRLLKDPASVAPISELGPDALLEPMTVEEFASSISKKKIGIKALLLDQSYISGIGNWIADEVLYQARIHPQQTAASLSKENCATLQNCIKEVVHYAVEVDADCSRFPLEWLFHLRWGKKPGKISGKVVLIYVIILTKYKLILQVIEKAIEVGADSTQFPDNWIFHSREKKPGKAFVDGKEIEFINAGGRTTALVPELQKLSETQAAKALGESRKQTFRKSSGGNEDANDDNVGESENEEELKTDNVKSKKRPNPKSGGKKPPAKMSKKNDVNDSDDDDDDNENVEDEKKKTGKVARKKVETKVEKTSKKNDQSSQQSKKAKKKAK